jgi:hypothetical protein
MVARHEVEHVEDNRSIVKVTCDMCNGYFEVHIGTTAYQRWREGQFIQSAAPELGVDERELLISNTCGPCFDSLFPPEAYEPDAGWPNGEELP